MNSITYPHNLGSELLANLNGYIQLTYHLRDERWAESYGDSMRVQSLIEMTMIVEKQEKLMA